MPPLILEGENLGDRHKCYNKLLKEAVTNNIEKLGKINHDDNDIDNFMRIDTAAKNKNVGYILEVLKDEDMLYVSRALKQCAWLVTEPQHAHIINPQHLHRNLFPHMTTKAINKLLLHIRKHLKDEKRVKAFYSYTNRVNPDAALKWLLHCPVQFILKVIRQRASDIPEHLFKRLLRRSPDILSVYLKSHGSSKILNYTQSALKKHPQIDIFLDLCNLCWISDIPNLREKITKIILKRCPDKILNDFGHYVEHIHLPTFVSFINKKEGIKKFILRHCNNGEQTWFRFDILKHFLDKMPREDTLDLLKAIFKIDKEEMGMADVFFVIEKKYNIKPNNVYRWYQYMPFHKAKYDLQKLIYAESLPEERQSMLSVLLACAGTDPNHVGSVLRYYHDRHINEPYKFKIPFVNHVLDSTSAHKFDEETWNLLNNLFHSMETYIESINDVTNCLNTIIVYKVLRNESVPKIIEEKFTYNTLCQFQVTLNPEENEKVFQYLYNYLTIRLQAQDLENETDYKKAINFLKQIWNLLHCYKKEKEYYQVVVDKIKELLEFKNKMRWIVDLAGLYNMTGRWRCHLFSESLSLCTSEETCLNVLKHEPQLIFNRSGKLHALRLFAKLRIYWPHTIAKEWTDEYLTSLCHSKPNEHKSLLRCLYTLLPPKKLATLVKEHIPVDKTIHWSEANETKISIRRHIASNMYLARPTLPIHLILEYAKGNYLHYAHLSINAIFINLSLYQFREHVPYLLDAPVSLQKHGIRMAFEKLKTNELKTILAATWKSTSNCTIRGILFKKIHELLYKERKTCLIKELWIVLSNFIDDLTYEEPYEIYSTFHDVDAVPLCVRVEYYVKSYHFLEKLGEKENYKYMFRWVLDCAVDIMEYLEPEFVTDILLESAYSKIKQDHSYMKIMAAYLLYSKDQKTLMERYNGLFKPILDHYVLKVERLNKHDARIKTKAFLKLFCEYIPKTVLKKKMVVPLQLVTNVFEILERTLDRHCDYVKLTSYKLIVEFIKLMHIENEINKEHSWDSMLQKLVPQLGVSLQRQLEEDMQNYFPLIYQIYADSCHKFFRRFQMDDMLIMCVIDELLKHDMVETYLLCIKLLPTYIRTNEKIEKKSQICKKIFSHPSPEVKMHYLHSNKDLPDFLIESQSQQEPGDVS